MQKRFGSATPRIRHSQGPPLPGSPTSRVRHSQGPPLPGSVAPRVCHSQGEPLYTVSILIVYSYIRIFFLRSTVVGLLFSSIQLLFQQIIVALINSNFYLHYDSSSIPLLLTLW